MSRKIFFYVDNGNIPEIISTETLKNVDFSNFFELPWDSYCILLFVAQQIDKSKTFKFYQATCSEYGFRINRNIPLGDLTIFDEYVSLNISELPQVISFLEKEVCPALEKLGEQDFFSIYGGKENFLKICIDELYDYVTPDEHFYNYEADTFLHHCNVLISFFKLCITLNKKYEVRKF